MFLQMMVIITSTNTIQTAVANDRILRRLEELSTISDDNDCLSRFYFTAAHQQASDLIHSWMEEAGLDVTKDTIGNIRGIYRSDRADAKHFVIGSHYDTVHDAGKYDGPLGILLGIEMAQRLKKYGIDLPFHLNCIAFADEEGSRFSTAYLGSSVIAGNFDHEWLSRKDDRGVSFQEVIEGNGGQVNSISDDQIPQEDWLGYFEVHIEQGPVLCKQDLPVCLVSGIAAQARVNVSWKGMAGHAGTSPMDIRNDALCAAAEFTLLIEDIGKKNKEQLVATVGKLNVSPNTSNVIPGMVTHSLDIRSPNGSFLSEMIELIQTKGKEIAQKRTIEFDWKLMQFNPAIDCDDQLQELLERSIKKGNISQVLKIPSGAGHDAVMISAVAPVSMLFVRCTEGISHNPLEYVESSDIKDALIVCNHFMDELISAHTI